MKALFIMIVILYTAFNLITAKLYSAQEMKQGLIDNQCIVGMIFANVFYLPAWALKGLRCIVVGAIK